jgi:hypothetical protein
VFLQAMLGLLIAAATELSTNQSVWSQIAGANAVLLSGLTERVGLMPFSAFKIA